jgi:chaperonin GroES
VLVEKVAPKKEIGGILLPESAATKFNHGKIIEVGQGKKTADGKIIPLSVKKGDFVMLNEWGGQTVKVNEKELHLVKEEDILGIVETEMK